VNAQIYNLLDAEVSDIDYYFACGCPASRSKASMISTCTLLCRERCA
jgi:hypothetical protein